MPDPVVIASLELELRLMLSPAADEGLVEAGNVVKDGGSHCGDFRVEDVEIPGKRICGFCRRFEGLREGVELRR